MPLPMDLEVSCATSFPLPSLAIGGRFAQLRTCGFSIGPRLGAAASRANASRWRVALLRCVPTDRTSMHAMGGRTLNLESWLDESGGRCRARTCDPQLVELMLYQLS